MNIQTFEASKLIYSFSKDHPPCAEVPLGKIIRIETVDSYNQQLNTEHTGEPIKLQQGINPATGPFFVEDVGAGDTLKVEILDIQVSNQGTMYLRRGAGMFGDLLSHAEVRKIPIESEMVHLPGGIQLDVRPMIGVIGVAPAGESVPTGSPGRHGGNMDTRFVAKGATLYLPVGIDGGLFAIGDLHASMGDGETGVCGVEVSGSVDLRFEKVSGRQEPWPILETESHWMVISSGDSLDAAAQEASHAMLQFIAKKTDHSIHDIVRLLSAAGHLEISQVVNPLKTVRMSIDKGVFQKELEF
jgi:amidase